MIIHHAFEACMLYVCLHTHMRSMVVKLISNEICRPLSVVVEILINHSPGGERGEGAMLVGRL